MKALDILTAEKMELNLTKTHLEVVLNGKLTKLSLDKIRPLEAALLRLEYAKHLILPGQDTAVILKQLENKEKKDE